MRITFVQFGDYAEAVHRFAKGGAETYYAQRYSVEFVGDLATKVEDVTVICVDAEPCDERLPNGVRGVGLRLKSAGMPALIRQVAATDPTHLILCTPLRSLLAWALRRRIRTLPVFADSFAPRGLLDPLRHRRLAAALNRRAVEFVGNHNVNASLSLRSIGVRPEKIVPWDWPCHVHPNDLPEKAGPGDPNRLRLISVGLVTEAKGVGDCIAALQLLRARGVPAELTIAGTGADLEALKARSYALGVGNAVTFAGRVPHDRVVPLMREHDAVVVASRHEYPEGLPMTIYEAYCSRTPLITSDHPMFRGKVNDGESALVFDAGDAAALAGKVQELMASPHLYQTLSRNGEAAWERIQCPVKWGDLIARWLSDSPEDRAWLSAHALGSGKYLVPSQMRR